MRIPIQFSCFVCGKVSKEMFNVLFSYFCDNLCIYSLKFLVLFRVYHHKTTFAYEMNNQLEMAVVSASETSTESGKQA